MKIIVSSFILALVSTSAFSQTNAVRIKHFNLEKTFALEGYDPVSYFQGKPRRGKSNLKFTYEGVTYLFSSQNNLNNFKTSPKKYEPAYGGWCAYAMGESGEQVELILKPLRFRKASSCCSIIFGETIPCRRG